MKKGVTLLELIIVVILLGVLATVAVPSYQGVVRRSRVAKALNAMTLLAHAEKIIQSETGAFLDAADGALDATIGATAVNDATHHNSGIDLFSVDADVDWTYNIAGGTITAASIAVPPITCNPALTYTVATNTHTECP